MFVSSHHLLDALISLDKISISLPVLAKVYKHLAFYVFPRYFYMMRRTKILNSLLTGNILVFGWFMVITTESHNITQLKV